MAKRTRLSELSQPGIESFQLIFGGIDEGDAHTHAFMHVNNFAFGFEGALITADAHIQIRTLR
jgi:hypothetical protein